MKALLVIILVISMIGCGDSNSREIIGQVRVRRILWYKSFHTGTFGWCELETPTGYRFEGWTQNTVKIGDIYEGLYPENYFITYETKFR